MTPRFSISQITTLNASFAEDLRAYADAGADGLGIWELKLPDDDGAAREALTRSGLDATNAVPMTPSILPLPLLPGPREPRERIDAICASLRRLARFEPACVLFLTGPGDRATVLDGLRRIEEAAADANVRAALEPYQREGAEQWSLVSTIPEALELLDEAGTPSIDVMFDVWHLWNCETILEDIADHIGRIAGVHVCDWRDPTRGWADRALPGEGIAPLPPLLSALESAGWRGPYDLEIFSDDGTFGSEYPDSFWKLPAAEAARRGRDAFFGVWEAAELD